MATPHRDVWYCMILTPLAQGLLLLTASPQFTGGPPDRSLAFFAFLAPVACYFWGLRSLLQRRRSWPLTLRLLLLLLASIVLSATGFVYGLFMITQDLANA